MKTLIYITAIDKNNKNFEHNRIHTLKNNQSISKVISDILDFNNIKWSKVKEIDIRNNYK